MKVRVASPCLVATRKYSPRQGQADPSPHPDLPGHKGNPQLHPLLYLRGAYRDQGCLAVLHTLGRNVKDIRIRRMPDPPAPEAASEDSSTPFCCLREYLQ